MSEKIKELKQDIAEIEKLENAAVRQKIKDILNIEKRKLISEIVNLEKTNGPEVPNNKPISTASAAGTHRYEVKINSYAYDQTKKFLKFYITMPKIQTVVQENINCKFTSKSFELKIQDLEGKDYVLNIKNLLHLIEPENCFWKVKKDMVVVSLAKKEENIWSHITEWEKKSNEANKPNFSDSDKKDPSESLMSLMKNMYDQGDDDMKRTIAKAWTDSQQKGQIS